MIIRKIPSRIANWVRNTLSDENISDAGCTYGSRGPLMGCSKGRQRCGSPPR